ncbi:MAG: helix-turn-helix domain-containing protein [Lawsonibacter sp.]
MEFGKKLKKIRLENGLSQQKLADKIFVSRSAVAKWENGLGFPSEESLEQLAKNFCVSKEFFATEEAEKTIINKNRKILKLSSSLYAAVALFIAIFILYALFHPVHYSVTATCNEIEVQKWDERPMSFKITDEETIEALIDILNNTTFQKSLRVNAGEDYPPSTEAILMLRAANGMGCTVMFCSTPQHACVYVSHSGGELVAVNPEILSNYIVQLLKKEA